MNRFFSVLLSAIVITTSISCSHKCDKLNIIFETDIGNDIDDALALDMLYKYHKDGKINFKAVMLNKCAPAPAEYMDIMNTWYGHPDMPVGIVRNGTDDIRGTYTQQVVDLKDKDGTPMFERSRGNYNEYPDAHILYRQILAGLPDKSVVIPSVGFSTNLARLLDTPADDYSPLTGKELVARKVKLLVAMAGHGADSCFREYNVMRDVPSAKKVLEQWPTPIVISPFELGYAIKYPGSSIENDFDWAPRHPMVESYKAYEKMPYDRPTWDLTAVLYAVEGGSMFTVSERCNIRVTDKGATIFTPDENGNVTYLMADTAQAEAINRRFQEIITSRADL